MVNPISITLAECFTHYLIEMLGSGQIRAKRLFNNNPRPETLFVTIDARFFEIL